jgi:hypothetical protein
VTTKRSLKLDDILPLSEIGLDCQGRFREAHCRGAKNGDAAIAEKVHF